MADYHFTTIANNAARDYEHLSVTPYSGALGADVGKVDLANASVAELDELKQALADHLVLFVRDQNLSLDAYETFAAALGRPGEDPYLTGLDSHPHIARLIKEADEKAPRVFGSSWHTDWSFLATPPAYTLLLAHDIPPYGGDTMFSNLYLVYEWLSPVMQAFCESLTVIHSAESGYGPNAKHNDLYENMEIRYDESALATREHPLVRTVPETGRKAIFANPVYARGIKGMKDAESANLLNYLYGLAKADAFTCRLRWSPGTLAIWDDRCTWHSPLSDYFGARREMYRTTIAGETPHLV